MPDDESSRLVLLAGISNLLLEELDRAEHQHLVNERLKIDLRALSALVEAELDAVANRRRLHLAGEGDSVVADD